MTKNIKRVKKNGETPFDAESFAFCLKELVQTDDALVTLRNILTMLSTAMHDDCGMKHTELSDLRATIDTMNNVFDDGVGVEKSFITQMAGSSEDLSAMIISPFTNSELWVVQLHDTFGYLDDLGIHAINCASMHESLEDDTPYMVGVIVIGPIKEPEIFRQVLWHEVTHYLMNYIKNFIDKDLIDQIDRIPNCTEFLADFLQFITFKTDLDDGYNSYEWYSRHFDKQVKCKYLPFERVVCCMKTEDSEYGKLL